MMARRDRSAQGGREIYFEHVVIGNAVKVSAVDSKSGTEVSISGPRSASQAELERVALQKLMRAMERSGVR